MDKNFAISSECSGEEFRELLIKEARRGIILITEIRKNISEYVIETNMYDSTIQESTRSIPIEEYMLWTILSVFVFEPEIGKKIMNYELSKDKIYIFHVEGENEGTFTRFVMYGPDGWGYGDLKFDSHLWPKTEKNEIVFLYFQVERSF